MSADRPFVRVQPGVQFGQPCVNGVRTENVTGMLCAGDSLQVVCEEYGLSRHEALTAVWFEVMHGRRPQWEDWARHAYDHLAGRKPVDELEPPEVGDG